MGLNHDKGTSGSCGGTDSRFGFRQPDTNYRSILAYGCTTGQCDTMPSGSCTRQQFFSTGNTADWQYNGQRQGWAANDPADLQGVGETNNAQKIRNVATTISLFNSPTGVTAAPTPAPTACTVNAQCEDGNACTENVCINNQCSIGSIFQGNSCDDSNPCTADDVCDAQGTCAGTVRGHYIRFSIQRIFVYHIKKLTVDSFLPLIIIIYRPRLVARSTSRQHLLITMDPGEMYSTFKCPKPSVFYAWPST